MPSTQLKGQTAPPEIGKRYVTIKQTLEMYDISDKTIERYISKGTLPVVRDRFGHVKIEFEALDQLMREKEIPPNPLMQQLQEHQKRIDRLEHEVQRLRELIETMTGRVYAP